MSSRSIPQMWHSTSRSDEELRAARVARTISLAFTSLFLLLICKWKPWELFSRGGYTTDFYEEQARAFLHGRVWVSPRVAAIEGFEIECPRHGARFDIRTGSPPRMMCTIWQSTASNFVLPPPTAFTAAVMRAT